MTAVTPANFDFDERLRFLIRTNLSQLERIEVPLDEHRHAAVAVVVVDGEPGGVDGAAILLTRRAARLRAHAGQWALPGGRLDDDESPVDAARRELLEELGLALDATSVLGRLDDYPTRSGYVISPVVFWATANPLLQPNPDEVHSVHRVSFRELTRPDSPRFITIAESDRPVVQVPIGSHLVHAPTAAVLLQFRRVGIEGVLERVAHYDQPRFAWR